MLTGLVRSPNRLTRRNLLLLLLLRRQRASFCCQQYYYYSSDRRGGPSLSNPSVASVLALRPDSNGPQRTQVTVAGFVRTIRNQKQRSFVELGDGSTIYALQAVVPPSHAKGYVFFVSCFFFLNYLCYTNQKKKKKKKKKTKEKEKSFFCF